MGGKNRDFFVIHNIITFKEYFLPDNNKKKSVLFPQFNLFRSISIFFPSV
jgi:hypothetical protein